MTNKTDDFRASTPLRSNATARVDRCFREKETIKSMKRFDIQSIKKRFNVLIGLLFFSLIVLFNQNQIFSQVSGVARSQKRVPAPQQTLPADSSKVINVPNPTLTPTLTPALSTPTLSNGISLPTLNEEINLNDSDDEINDRPIVSRETNRPINSHLSSLLEEMEEDDSSKTNPVTEFVSEQSSIQGSNIQPSKRSHKSLRSQPVAQLLTIDEESSIESEVETTPNNILPSIENQLETESNQEENSVPSSEFSSLDSNVASIDNPIQEKEETSDVQSVKESTANNETLSANQALTLQPLDSVSSNEQKWNRRENPQLSQELNSVSEIPQVQLREPSDTQSFRPETLTARKPVVASQEPARFSELASDSLNDSQNSAVSPKIEDLSAASNVSDPSQLVVKQQSPVIDIQAIGLQKLIVGQESSYELKVSNKSSVDVQQLVIATEIPGWVNVIELLPSIGTSNILPKESPESSIACQWKIGTLAAGKEESLILKLIPQKRNNFELVSRYDYEQATLKAGVEVQEPIIELLVEGRDSIEWGLEDNYRLRIRNVGNGDAENVQLLVSTGENEQATQLLPVLKAGEEKVMDMSIKTVLENEITIHVEANGKYGLNANVQKTIAILRGKLDLFVEAPELQFVNNSVDYLVHISNTGTAPLKNIDVAANLPSEVKLISCSGDGKENAEKNQIVWSIPVINPNENIVYQVSCEMIRSGLTRLDVSASEPFGLAATSEALVQVEAIAALNMKINAPNAPAAVGSSVLYEVVISNNGTKAAEEINSGLFLANGLRPLTVAGSNGFVYPEESKVLFKQIDLLQAGQSVTFQVQAEVIASGNQKVQAILDSKPNNIQLASEEVLYCYEKRNIANRNVNTQSKVALRPTDSQQIRVDNGLNNNKLNPSKTPVQVSDSNSQNMKAPNSNGQANFSIDLTQNANNSLEKATLLNNQNSQKEQTQPLMTNQTNSLEVPFPDYSELESGNSVRF